ncbi:MAG: indolepyruvate ferredoxin oxidoreductase, partial [Rhizobacter sp.]|nr:indolepyruvate ferredoxin oxidoreductase [Rhizobacter sp.]
EKVEHRWPAAVKFIEERGLNEFFGGSDAAAQDVGIIVQGGSYNTLIRALERLGLSDVYGNSRIPLYVLNVAYPLIDSELTRFCAGKRAVMIVEEGQPNYIEQSINTTLRQADLQTRVVGKGPLPIAGEYTTAVLIKGLRAFIGDLLPSMLPPAKALAAGKPNKAVEIGSALATSGDAPAGSLKGIPVVTQKSLDETVHARPPGFCTGCPERPVFTAVKLLEREIGEHHISADIGCHLFSILPPFNLGNTTMGYGLGGAGSSALNAPTGRRAISVMGDGGFWHNGLTSGIANSVFNKSDNLTIIIDNNYTAATGGQDILSSKAENRSRSTFHPIEQAVRGVGVTWVRTMTHTYDVKGMRAALKEALTTQEKGPKVIIAQSECMLNKQRREKPLVRKAVADGKRVVRERFGIDSDTCTGDHSCIRLSGCPSLSIKPNPDPLRRDPVAHVQDSCVGCGLCGEVAHAAVLCPSFYRAEIVSNPTRWDRFAERMRSAVIGSLQRRISRRLAATAF